MQRIDEHTIEEAARRLRAAAPEAAIFLFGSHARGDFDEDSDLDFLVVEPQLCARHEEMVRLRDALRPMRVPVDIVVADAETFEEWAAVPGTLYHEIKTEGKILHAFDQQIGGDAHAKSKTG